jgi:hypothetical protein
MLEAYLKLREISALLRLGSEPGSRLEVDPAFCLCATKVQLGVHHALTTGEHIGTDMLFPDCYTALPPL